VSSILIRAGLELRPTVLLVLVLGSSALPLSEALQHGDMAAVKTASGQAGWSELMAEGRKLRNQSRYADAEQCLHSAISLAEEFGSLDPRYAESLDTLATVVQIRGRYDEAESLFQRALVIWKQYPGEHGLDLAVGLSNMANLLRVKGQYPEGERFQLQALDTERAVLPCIIVTEASIDTADFSLRAHRQEQSSIAGEVERYLRTGETDSRFVERDVGSRHLRGRQGSQETQLAFNFRKTQEILCHEVPHLMFVKLLTVRFNPKAS
jgi:tetratricopeptide (TPR) repeat protein